MSTRPAGLLLLINTILGLPILGLSKQLTAGKTAANFNVFLKLPVIKPLLVKWIVDFHYTLKDDKEMAINGFRSAGITKAIQNAKDMVENLENPFIAVWL